MYKLTKKRYVSERPTTDQRLLDSREKAEASYVLTLPDGTRVFSANLADLETHVKEAGAL